MPGKFETFVISSANSFLSASSVSSSDLFGRRDRSIADPDLMRLRAASEPASELRMSVMPKVLGIQTTWWCDGGVRVIVTAQIRLEKLTQ
jgi:hypothetical protein